MLLPEWALLALFHYPNSAEFEQVLLKPLPPGSGISESAEECSLEAADRMLPREMVVPNLGILHHGMLGSR